MTDGSKSPFRKVPQDHVLQDDRHFGADDVEVGFFSDALAQPQPQAQATFTAGIEAMGGLDPDGRPVPFSGDLAADPAARAAFILRGPAGVTRTG